MESLQKLFDSEMMCDIDVSIVIPVYNAGALINRCLDSVFSQLGGYSIEVILVDDGSTDNSVELINARKEQNKIRLFQQVNSGPSKARNKGITEAKSKYLAFLDADDYWMPEFIGRTVEFLETNPKAIAVSVAQKHLTTSGEHEAPENWESLASHDGTIIGDFFDFWAKHNHICTGSILIRTNVAKKSNGMRTDLRICEDLEYWAHLSTFGYIGYIPEILFVSDGAKVTENIGWVKKHLPRWNAAVPVDEWQRRLLIDNKDLQNNYSFKKARGRIAQNLTYSILLSKRYELAKEQIKKYGDSFPRVKMGNLLRVAVKNPLIWFIISRVLVYREYHRK